MLLLASILAIGLLLGLGFGGSFRNLGQLDVRLWWLIPLGFVLQIVPLPPVAGEVGRYLPFVVLLLSFVLIGIVMATNWRLRGFPTILLGVLLNLVPIAINQGMPVSGQAVVESGGSLADVPRGIGEKHHLQEPDDKMTFLADVIAVRPPFQAVVSVGDLVMWLGAGWFVIVAMKGAPRRSSPGRHRSPGRRSATT